MSQLCFSHLQPTKQGRPICTHVHTPTDRNWVSRSTTAIIWPETERQATWVCLGVRCPALYIKYLFGGHRPAVDICWHGYKKRPILQSCVKTFGKWPQEMSVCMVWVLCRCEWVCMYESWTTFLRVDLSWTPPPSKILLHPPLRGGWDIWVTEGPISMEQ